MGQGLKIWEPTMCANVDNASALTKTYCHLQILFGHSQQPLRTVQHYQFVVLQFVAR